MRSIVARSIERSFIIDKNCLGECFRESGQKRVPLPPAIITAYIVLSKKLFERFFNLVAGFFFFFLCCFVVFFFPLCFFFCLLFAFSLQKKKKRGGGFFF